MGNGTTLFRPYANSGRLESEIAHAAQGAVALGHRASAAERTGHPVVRISADELSELAWVLAVLAAVLEYVWSDLPAAKRLAITRELDGVSEEARRDSIFGAPWDPAADERAP